MHQQKPCLHIYLASIKPYSRANSSKVTHAYSLVAAQTHHDGNIEDAFEGCNIQAFLLIREYEAQADPSRFLQHSYLYSIIYVDQARMCLASVLKGLLVRCFLPEIEERNCTCSTCCDCSVKQADQ